jgi:hypothetical protein
MWVIVRHRVKDYKAWRPHFDGPDAFLHQGGAKRGLLFRSVDPPDELWVLLEWDSAEAAHKFMDAPELRRAMEESGVVGEPDITFLEELDPPRL